MVCLIMGRFVVYFVFICVVSGSLSVSTHQVEDSEIQLITDIPETDLDNEVNTSYDASLDNFEEDERSKRDAFPERSVSTHSDVRVSRLGDGVYLKDNIETQRLRQGEATITRVIHHGIYPSLNVTRPLSRSNWTGSVKSRAKRDPGGRGGSSSTRTDYRYEMRGSANGTFNRVTTIQVNDGPRTVFDRRDNLNSSVFTTYQAQYPPNNDARRRQKPPNYRTPSPPKFGRTKRSSGYAGNLHSASRNYESTPNGSFHRETSTQVKNKTEPVYDWRDNQNRTVKTSYQAYYPPYNSSAVHNNDSVRSYSYARAVHPVNGTKDYSFYTHQFPQPIANRTNSTKYRTVYYPADNSVYGDGNKVSNKGNVRLISVGYYSVNESRDGMRSYNNPPGGYRAFRESPMTNRFEPSRHRRSTSGSWGWIDRLIVSIGLGQLEEKQNEIPEGSETIKLDVDDSNDVLQNHYGYSSNGHHHAVQSEIDRIYLVGGATTPSTSTAPTTAAANEETPQGTYESISGSSDKSLSATPEPEMSENAETPLVPVESTLPAPNPLSPRTDTVLIQAPARMNNCTPPKRLARGRCRTVW